MESMKDGYSDEYLARLKDFFLNNPDVSMEEMANNSEQLFGKAIPFELLRKTVRPWMVERTATAAENAGDISHEVNTIRRVIYRQIIAAEQGGIFISGSQAEEAVEIIKSAGLDIEITTFRPGGVDHNLVNAYMNLLAKSNLKFNLDSSSAKTSRERALEIAREALDERPAA